MEEKAQAKITVIKYSCRVSTKIKDNFYTFEYGEERSVPENADIDRERDFLINDCTEQINMQIKEL